MRIRLLLTLIACGALACSGGEKGAPQLTPSLDPPAAAGSTAPRLSALGDRLVLSWIEPSASGPALRFSTRDARGWSAPKTVVADPLLAVDPANVPGVVPLAGGGWAAHWSTNTSTSTEHARNLSVATSADGTTWSLAPSPHDTTIATDRSMAALVPAPAGNGFGIVWLDGRAGQLSEYGEGGTGLYWADWDGSRFAPEKALDERVCDCCKTSAAATAAGPIVAYRDRGSDERRDISLVARRGATWSSPTDVRDDGWRLTACPTNGPAVATRDAWAAVAWFSGGGNEKAVRATISADGGATWSAPTRLDAGDPVGRVEAAVLPDGSAAVAWIERVGTAAEVRLRRVGTDGIPSAPVTVAVTGPSKKSGYPRVAATGPREALVAWIDTTGPETRLRAASVSVP